MNELAWDIYLKAAARLQQQGDTEQAEKILKSGLKDLERYMSEAEVARSQFLDTLLALYDTQGKHEEALKIRTRMCMPSHPVMEKQSS